MSKSRANKSKRSAERPAAASSSSPDSDVNDAKVVNAALADVGLVRKLILTGLLKRKPQGRLSLAFDYAQFTDGMTAHFDRVVRNRSLVILGSLGSIVSIDDDSFEPQVVSEGLSIRPDAPSVLRSELCLKLKRLVSSSTPKLLEASNEGAIEVVEKQAPPKGSEAYDKYGHVVCSINERISSLFYDAGLPHTGNGVSQALDILEFSAAAHLRGSSFAIVERAIAQHELVADELLSQFELTDVDLADVNANFEDYLKSRFKSLFPKRKDESQTARKVDVIFDDEPKLAAMSV